MTQPRDADATAPVGLMQSSFEMRDGLRAYLEARRGRVPLTSEGAFERGQLDRWIIWLRGAI